MAKAINDVLTLSKNDVMLRINDVTPCGVSDVLISAKTVQRSALIYFCFYAILHIGGDNMSLQTVEINSAKTTFDKEKTREYRINMNKPCDCQNCRNYYKNIKNNKGLVEFLSNFGIDFTCAEEVFSWDLGNDKDSLIHHEGYYGVFGKIEGEEFDFEKFGVKITFQKDASVPCDRTDECFWICVDGDFPYILEEERELPITFSQKIQRSNIISKIKAIFKKY